MKTNNKLLKTAINAAIGLLLAIIPACNSDMPEGSTYETQDENKEIQMENLDAIPYAPIQLTRSQEECVLKSNGFAIRNFEYLLENSTENVFFGPMSLTTALSIVTNGANGATLNEILSAIGVESIEQLNEFYKYIIPALQNADTQVVSRSYNSLWINDDFNVKDEFINCAQNYYKAEVRVIPINEKTHIDINTWVAEYTKNLIKELIRKPLTNSTQMVAINASYFKGKWNTPFKLSEKREFNNFVDQAKLSDFMEVSIESTSYEKREEYEKISIPYGNGAYRMNIIIPEKGMELSSVNLSNMDFSESEKITRVELYMPKFNIEYRNEDLMGMLRSQGINSAFASGADFSKLSDLKLYISEVIQESVINVDESGAEAASATQINMDVIIDTPPEISNAKLVLDRPFIFFITEKSTGMILYCGALRNL